MTNPDVVVVGGGPAGAVAAAGLARIGLRVVVVTLPRRPTIEGLSGRVREGLENAGCARALAAIGPAVRREVRWGDIAGAPNREWVMERERFDRALLADAASAGVDVVDGRASTLRRFGDGWDIRLRGDGSLTGRFLIEARGRQAPGVTERGPATTALVRRFARLPAVPRSAVATFPAGWAWFVGTGDGRGTVQLFVNGAGLPPRERIDGFFDALLETIDEAGRWLGGGSAAGSVVARHAGIARARRVTGPGHLRIGDAALALDPLSGHGVFEALASAIAAVPAVRTILERPDQAALAQRFLEERVDHAFLRFARIARDFYRLEPRFADKPFWNARQAWPDGFPAHAPPSAAPPEIAARPVVVDGRIELREVVVTADQPRGVYQVEGVPLVPLLRELRPDLEGPSEAVTRRPIRSPAALATAEAWLRFRGMLD